MTVQEIFEGKIGGKMKEKADKVKEINAVYQFKIKDAEPSDWVVDCVNVVVKSGISPEAKCTVTISLENLEKLIEKKLNPQMAFITGKLKVQGNMGLALKLGAIL